MSDRKTALSNVEVSIRIFADSQTGTLKDYGYSSGKRWEWSQPTRVEVVNLGGDFRSPAVAAHLLEGIAASLKPATDDKGES